MKVLPVDAVHPERSAITAAAEVLRSGGLVAFPTETVYGLGADALNPAALERIFTAKGRPAYNPLIAHCLDAVEARSLASTWPDDATRLADAFWPGPLTVVLPKNPLIPARLTAGLDTVAIRVPSHPVARALLAEARIPIAAPSANRFTELSPTRAEHVVKALAGRVDLILDGGSTSVGIESTVVDLSGNEPVLLRPGSISISEIERVLGKAVRFPERPVDGAARPSPGMVERHYSPRATLRITFGSADEVAEAVGDSSTMVGALTLTSGDLARLEHSLQMPSEPGAYARALYAALHELDERGCDLVLVEAVPVSPEWAGIRDRLERASHPG